VLLAVNTDCEQKETITHNFSHGILADDCTLINDLQSSLRRARPATKVDPIEAMNLNLFRNLSSPPPQSSNTCRAEPEGTGVRTHTTGSFIECGMSRGKIFIKNKIRKYSKFREI
jgi:hypothetical protein